MTKYLLSLSLLSLSACASGGGFKESVLETARDVRDVSCTSAATACRVADRACEAAGSDVQVIPDEPQGDCPTD